MAADKETIMLLKVDLQCPCCYKKIKKILCKFPQIRDQVYDEKGNMVTITVLCCNPEKIRDKLCCKGAKVIKSIEIKEHQKPKEKEKKPKEPGNSKPKEPVTLPNPPKQPEPVPVFPPKIPVPLPNPPKVPEPVPVCDFLPRFPVRTCCGQCYEGYGGGPCYHGYGVPPPPPPCYAPYGYGYGGYGRYWHMSRCDHYFSEENSSSCSIM